MCVRRARVSLPRMTPPRLSTYRIVVRGRLSDRLGAAFGEMTLEPEDGATALVGAVTDQSHLYGLLERVRSLGLELLRVEPVCP
jgi:hypothetical protein